MISSMDLSQIHRRLVEQASDGLWLLDRDFLTVYVNPALEEMLGYTVAEMTGRSWYDFGDTGWVERAKELENRRESGIKEPHKFLFIHKNGSQVLTRIATTPLYDDNGNFDGAIGVLSNITRQQEIEDSLKLQEKITRDALREAEFNLSDLQQKTRLGNWQYDPVDQQAFWSKEMFAIFGRDPQLGTPNYAEHKEMIHPDDFECFDTAVREALEEGKPYVLELRLCRPDKTERTIVTICEPQVDISGTVVTLRGSVQDITARKNAERELATLRELSLQMAEKRTEEIRKSERFTNDIIDSMHSHIAVLDATGKIIKVNKSWKRFAAENGGHHFISDFIGTNYLSACKASLDSNNDQDATAAFNGINSVLLGETEHFSMEYPCHSPEEQRWFLMTVTILNGNQGVVVSHSNITKRKQAEQQLQKWATIFSNASWGVVAGNVEGTKFELMNNSFASMHGYTVDELNAKPIAEVFAPEVRAGLPEIFKLIREKGHHTFESLHIRKDGSVFPVLVDANIVKDEYGNILYRAVNVQDITERKQAEIIMKESEQRFKNMFQRHSAVMLLVEPESGTIVDANDAAAQFYGYARERLQEMNITELNTLAPDLVTDERDKALHEKRNYFIFPHKLSSGEIRTVEVHSTPIEVNNKQLLFSVIHDITERSRAEAKLAKLSEEQAIILDNAGVGISFVQNRQQKWANRTFCEIFGYKAEEMEGSSTSTHFLSPEAYAQFTEEAYPVLAAGETFSKSLLMRRKDGTLFHAQFTGKAVKPENLLDGAIWILSDETVQKELEEKLQQSHDLLTTLSHQIPGTIYQFQLFPDGRSCFPYASEAIIEMYAVTPEEIREDATPVFANLHPDDIAGVTESIMESARTLEPWECDYRVKLPQKGAVGWRHGFSRPERLADGSTLWHGFINDITERKLTEDKLRKLSRAIEQSPVTIMITDLQGKIEFINPKFTELTGYSFEEVIGQSVNILKTDQTPPEAIEEMWATIAMGNTWEGEFHNKTKDGRIFCEHAVISPLLDGNGTATHYLAVKEDISEKKAITEQLVAAKEQADAANRAKSEFLANMSHEIRTPLNGLLGMAQLLEMTGLTEEQREYVVDLRRSGKNLVSLVNDILDLSKIEAGKIMIETAEFSLRRAIDEVYLMQKSAIFDKKLAFDITIAKEIPTVIIGDQLRVKQILHNLLGNAAKFTKQGGITISVQVRERHYGSHIIQIAITDTGIGISPEALDKIFKPFVQEDGSTTRQFGGTGLGLTISRRLAELMGGTISVESSQGVGSSFIVKLPFIIPTIQHTTEILSQITPPVWDGPSLRILLVEDNPINIKFGTILLGKHGHRVVTAENGEECLQALAQGEFDLVLMDIQMPDMNGEEALRTIRAQEEKTSCHQKVIALTAHALRNEKERFLGEGFDGYLSKPMEQQELIDEMKRVMSL